MFLYDFDFYYPSQRRLKLLDVLEVGLIQASLESQNVHIGKGCLKELLTNYYQIEVVFDQWFRTT